MTETISVFGVEIAAYYLFAAIGVILAPLCIKLTRRRLPKGTCIVLGLLGAVFGLLLGRGLYYAVNWNRFVYHCGRPEQLLRFADGTISIVGVVAGVILATVLTARLMKTSVGKLLDALAVSFGLFIAMLRLGEQFTALGVGSAVEESFMTQHFPWLFLQSHLGVFVEYRLNVWLYEAAVGVLIFAVALLCAKKLGDHAGDTAIVVFSLYGASQILLESMRDDGHMLIIFLRVGQLGAVLLPVVCSGILMKRVKNVRISVAACTALLLCIAAVTVLEFSLDGRLTFGEPTLLRDWSLMAVACAGLFITPCALLRAARRREHISAHQ